MSNDSFHRIQEGVRSGQLLAFCASGAGKLSRQGALNLALQMMARADARSGPLLVITEDIDNKHAWVDALATAPLTALVVDFDTAERCLSGMDTTRWSVLLDYKGSREQAFGEYGARINLLLWKDPRLFMLATSTVERPGIMLSIHHQQGHAATLGSKHVKLVKFSELQLTIQLADDNEAHRAWPKYAVLGNRIYRRADPLYLKGVTYNYQALSEDEQYALTNSGGGIRELKYALVFE